MESPIFILGSHKSGTSLLRSLFDGHPNIFAIPVETHFFQLMTYWVTYAFSKRILPADLSMEHFIENAIGAIHYFNQEDNSQGDGISKGLFNIHAFEHSIRKNLKNIDRPHQSEDVCFRSYIQAIYQSLHAEKMPTQKRILEKSVENVEFALDIHRIFPHSKFIHIVRNPYANLESMRKFRMYNKRTRNYPWLGRDFRSLHQTFYFLYRNQKFIPNYKVIRYEDLVARPQAILEELCLYLNLSFQDSVLEPTYMGKPWLGNSTSSEQFKGISDKSLNQYIKTIDPIVISLVNKYLPHILDVFEYEVLEAQRFPLWPASKEGPKEYVANRFLLSLG
jgi:hypothetical protein